MEPAETQGQSWTVSMNDRENYRVVGVHVESREGGTVFQWRENFEIRNNLVIKILHCHGRDVTELLEDLKSPWGILVFGDGSENTEDLVDDLARDEAAEVDIDKLDEGHAKERDSSLYCS